MAAMNKSDIVKDSMEPARHNPSTPDQSLEDHKDAVLLANTW